MIIPTSYPFNSKKTLGKVSSHQSILDLKTSRQALEIIQTQVYHFIFLQHNSCFSGDLKNFTFPFAISLMSQGQKDGGKKGDFFWLDFLLSFFWYFQQFILWQPIKDYKQNIKNDLRPTNEEQESEETQSDSISLMQTSPFSEWPPPTCFLTLALTLLNKGDFSSHSFTSVIPALPTLNRELQKWWRVTSEGRL